MHDSLITNRIVCGIRDGTVRARFLSEAELSQAKAVEICQANEITSRQVKALNEEVDMHTIKTVKIKHKINKCMPVQCDSNDDTKCNICGYKHEQRKCPAYGQMCRLCNEKKTTS